jgi:hypothetical protein
MQVKSCPTILFSISLCAVSLFGVIASTSSKNKIHGARAFASSKVCLSNFSVSPDKLETNEGADIGIRGILKCPARQFTKRVFPPPGTPCSRIPRVGDV